MADEDKPTFQNKATQFKKGNVANPGGRPVGTRNKLSKQFFNDLWLVWNRRGVGIIERLADEKPDKLVQLIADLMPQQAELVDATTDPAGAERLSDNITWLRELIERNRAEREAEISEPERPLLSAPLHTEES